MHEWHLVSRTPQFKYWDITAEKIRELRTAISDVKFINPEGVHGGLGSTKHIMNCWKLLIRRKIMICL